MRSVLLQVRDGTAGVRDKLRALRAVVEQGKRDPEFRALALGVVRSVREGDVAGELGAISRWVRRMVRYRRDPVGVELYTSPDLLGRLAQNGEAAGDCDDHVAIGSALAEVLGHPSRFVVGGFRDGPDATWAHVWRQTWDARAGRWRTFDDTAKGKPPGWSPAGRFELTMVEPPERGTSPMRLGLPCVDAAGCVIPGLAQLVDVNVDGLGRGGLRKVRKMAKRHVRAVSSGGWSEVRARRKRKRGRRRGSADSDYEPPTAGDVEGLGKFLKRRKKMFKKVGKKLGKLGKKALPVAALVANVIPGVGQAASAALAVAAAAVAQRERTKRARAAAAAAEREQAAAEAAYAQAAEPAPIPMPAMPMTAAPYEPSGTQTFQPLPAYTPEPPEPAQSWAPLPEPPAQVFEPAWPEDASKAALGALGEHLKDNELAGIWDTITGALPGVLRGVQEVAQSGRLTVGGVALPVGRRLQRVGERVSGYASLVQPTLPTSPPRPTPSVVFSPPPAPRPAPAPAPRAAPAAAGAGGMVGLLAAAGLLLMLMARR